MPANQRSPVARRSGRQRPGGIRFKEPAGVGTTGAPGAIDRLTHEILLSLEQRKTLVVWLFDATVSLSQQRNEIHDRIDRIYKELGVIDTSGNPGFAKHADKPLLTSVVAFGKVVVPQIKTPTDNLTEIKLAVSTIKVGGGPLWRSASFPRRRAGSGKSGTPVPTNRR